MMANRAEGYKKTWGDIFFGKPNPSPKISPTSGKKAADIATSTLSSNPSTATTLSPERVLPHRHDLGWKFFPWAGAGKVVPE